LKAAQKLVAVPTETLVVFVDVELVAFADAGPVDVGDAELVGVLVVGWVELATLLVPEEHPARTATVKNMKESRRIAIHPARGFV
jgi:hypothetical protein